MNPPPPGAGDRALDDPGDERGRDAGVDRAAAVGEHARARLGGQGMARSDRASHGAETTELAGQEGRRLELLVRRRGSC